MYYNNLNFVDYICLYSLLFIIIFKIIKIFTNDISYIFKLSGEIFAIINSILFFILSILEFIKKYNYNIRNNILKLFTSYYLFDIIIVLVDIFYFKNYLSFIFIIHHILTLCINYILLYKSNVNETFTYILCCIEITNIFRAIYCIINIYTHKNNIFNLVTLISWIVIFIIFRLIIIPIIIGKIAFNDIKEGFINKKYGLILLILLIIVQILSMIWSYKLIKKFEKL